MNPHKVAKARRLADSDQEIYDLNFRISPGKSLLWVELYPRQKIHMLKSLPPVPQNVTLFEDRVFIKVIKLK